MQRNMLKNDEKLDKRIRPNKAMKGLKKKKHYDITEQAIYQ